MEKRINVEKFISFVLTTYGESNNEFERYLLYNLIEYGVKNHCVSKDQLAYFLSDIIPNVEFKDVIKFMNDECLTENAKKMKYGN